MASFLDLSQPIVNAVLPGKLDVLGNLGVAGSVDISGNLVVPTINGQPANGGGGGGGYILSSASISASLNGNASVVVTANISDLIPYFNTASGTYNGIISYGGPFVNGPLTGASYQFALSYFLGTNTTLTPDVQCVFPTINYDTIGPAIDSGIICNLPSQSLLQDLVDYSPTDPTYNVTKLVLQVTIFNLAGASNTSFVVGSIYIQPFSSASPAPPATASATAQKSAPKPFPFKPWKSTD